MTKKQLLNVLDPLVKGGYSYEMSPRLFGVVRALVQTGAQELPGVATAKAPKAAVLGASVDELLKLLRALTTDDGSVVYKLHLSDSTLRAIEHFLQHHTTPAAASDPA